MSNKRDWVKISNQRNPNFFYKSRLLKKVNNEPRTLNIVLVKLFYDDNSMNLQAASLILKIIIIILNIMRNNHLTELT